MSRQITKKYYKYISAFFYLLFLVIYFIKAQTSNSCLDGCPLPNYGAFDSLSALIDKIAWFIAAIAFPIAGMAFIWAGINFVTARGDETKIKAAKQNLSWAIVGAFIAIGAYVFVNTIKKVIETFAPRQ